MFAKKCPGPIFQIPAIKWVLESPIFPDDAAATGAASGAFAVGRQDSRLEVKYTAAPDVGPHESSEPEQAPAEVSTPTGPWISDELAEATRAVYSTVLDPENMAGRPSIGSWLSYGLGTDFRTQFATRTATSTAANLQS